MFKGTTGNIFRMPLAAHANQIPHEAFYIGRFCARVDLLLRIIHSLVKLAECALLCGLACFVSVRSLRTIVESKQGASMISSSFLGQNRISAAGRNRNLRAWAAVSLPVCAALAFSLLTPTTAVAAKGEKVTIRTVTVGDKGNPAIGIVPFTDAIYSKCSLSTSADCLRVGKVKYRYQIGELEVTVRQWVKFLNTVDPNGNNPRDLYNTSESGDAWPKYGQIDFKASATPGKRYRPAFAQWKNKPYGFADFLRAARFANSVHNGKILRRDSGRRGEIKYKNYRVRLSPVTETGMYDLARNKRTGATRAKKRGFMIPSQNEWIKSAYYDRHGGGTYSYWKYPTTAGVFGDGSLSAPNATVLDPGTGEVTNGLDQPVATFHASGEAAPTWCPSQVEPVKNCDIKNPIGLNPIVYPELFRGSVGSVGQANTRSPWGTLDQAGNAVEWTDTITPGPTGGEGRVWRRLHGGVPNAPAYQLWLSAVGLQPQDNAFFDQVYPWLGFRLGAIGNPKVSGLG
jgi:formylglycine-generating enzyme required for sulfatase activity